MVDFREMPYSRPDMTAYIQEEKQAIQGLRDARS